MPEFLSFSGKERLEKLFEYFNSREARSLNAKELYQKRLLLRTEVVCNISVVKVLGCLNQQAKMQELLVLKYPLSVSKYPMPVDNYIDEVVNSQCENVFITLIESGLDAIIPLPGIFESDIKPGSIG